MGNAKRIRHSCANFSNELPDRITEEESSSTPTPQEEDEI